MNGERPLAPEEEASLRSELRRAEDEGRLGWWGQRYLRLFATLDAARTTPEPGEGLRTWKHGQHGAMWEDPEPRTPEGQRLWRLFRDGKLGTSASGIRDFGQRVCQIESEAAAPEPTAERLDGLERAVIENAREWAADDDKDCQCGLCLSIRALDIAALAASERTGEADE